MKYITPEIEWIQVSDEDILTASVLVDAGIGDGDVIDFNDIFQFG